MYSQRLAQWQTSLFDLDQILMINFKYYKRQILSKYIV
jgi:hypothetical protein